MSVRSYARLDMVFVFCINLIKTGNDLSNLRLESWNDIYEVYNRELWLSDE
jgi:hypothetical protein